MKLDQFSMTVKILMMIGIVVLINIIASFVRFDIDLTEDKLFSVTEHTKSVIESMDDNVTIKVFLDGKFPAGFKRLQLATEDLIKKLRDVNGNIVYEFEDPAEGSPAIKERRLKQLKDDKMIPVNLSYYDGKQLVQKPIFPFAVVNYKQSKVIINLLEEQTPGEDEEQILNKSVSLLEYKFANALKKLSVSRKKTVLFTEGYGEWNEALLVRLEEELRKYYFVGRANLDTVFNMGDYIDLLIIAGPKSALTDQNQFKIDQYIMSGGRVLWLIDKFQVNLDSINKHKFYVPEPVVTNLDNMLFKYGARVNTDFVADLECSQIPQVVGMAGERVQTALFPWIYHMAAAAKSGHPIVKNIDRVNLFFPSSIDTIKTDANISKIPLLSSSTYSKRQLYPVRLTFEILKTDPDPSKFKDGMQTVALLLEGEFESYFKNRLTDDFKAMAKDLKIDIKDKSVFTSQIVVSDSEFAKNLVNFETGATEDIGYNKWERRYYNGNKDFILNSIEYLLGGSQILEARSKEVKLRLLDKVKVRDEKLKWQLINIVLPIAFLFVFGFLYNYLRKRRYTI